jgi:mRNA (2'-O-methyladenosine-N6-)-methyltransferase
MVCFTVFCLFCVILCFANARTDEYEIETFDIPPHCIPIRGDVRLIKWKELGAEVQFDVIMMDPPWQLAGANPTRGVCSSLQYQNTLLCINTVKKVALGYSQLKNNDIEGMDIPALQKHGFIFVWVINARYQYTMDMLEKWGYRFALCAHFFAKITFFSQSCR